MDQQATDTQKQPGQGTEPTAQKKEQIKKDDNLGEVVFKYPQLTEVLLDYGLHCVGCFANSFDTIEMGAKVHGMTDEMIDELVNRLNEVIETGE